MSKKKVKIYKQDLIDDILDTESNNFDEEVVKYLFDKYHTSAYVVEDETLEEEVMFEEQFKEACNEFLEFVVNFIKSAKTVK